MLWWCREGCSWSGEFFERWCCWDREDCGWIYSNAPRRARAWAPQLPPQQAGVFAVCPRLIGCTSLASHANAAGIHIQTCGCSLDTPNYSLPDTKVTKRRDTASHPAISCGWSDSPRSRPSLHPLAAHRTGPIRQHRVNRSSCRPIRYRAGLACPQGRPLSPPRRWVGRQTVCLRPREYLGLPI